MENYKVNLIYGFVFHISLFRESYLYNDCCSTCEDKFLEEFYNGPSKIEKVITGNFKISQFKDGDLQEKYWSEYEEIFKKNLPDTYKKLKPVYVDKSFRWEYKSYGHFIGTIHLHYVELLKRPPKIIFKKVFANIVLKSLLNDIYKPGSKRFQKCQERFLENSNRIK